MKITHRFGLGVLLATSFLLISRPSMAGYVPLPTTMDNLTPLGNYTTVGDKTFTFLSYSSTTSNGGTPVSANSIEVTALSGASSAPSEPYGFQMSGSIAAAANTNNDIAIAYSVTSSGNPITQVNLFSNGSATGSGFTEVSESVFTLSSNGGAGKFLGQLNVIGAGTAFLNLSGYSGLYITKDIQFNLGTTGGSASLSIVDQTFNQSVPEPASVAMMGMGLAGAYAFARSRRKGRVA